MSDDYTATGSGMQLAYGVLEQDYETDLSNDEASQIAARAVESAIERDTASGDGVFLATITADGVDIHGHKDFDEVLD
jgi:proteasome beta subunit